MHPGLQKPIPQTTQVYLFFRFSFSTSRDTDSSPRQTVVDVLTAKMSEKAQNPMRELHIRKLVLNISGRLQAMLRFPMNFCSY